MQTLYDESRSSPRPRFWLGLSALVVAAIVGGVLGYPLIFPEESSLTAITPLDQLNVSADTRAIPTKTGIVSETKVVTKTPIEFTSFTDEISGISVRYPNDWLSRSNDGQLILRSDSCGASTAIFYPAERLEDDFSAADLLKEYLKLLSNTVTTNDDTLALGTISDEQTNQSSALLSGQLCGNEILGSVSITLAGERMLFKAGWAPKTLGEGGQTMLGEILQSYKTHSSATLLKVNPGTRFRIAAPENWTFSEQEQSAMAELNDERILLAALAWPISENLGALANLWLQFETDSGKELSNQNEVSAFEYVSKDSKAREWQLRSIELEFSRSGVQKRGWLTTARNSTLGDTGLVLWVEGKSETWRARSALYRALLEQSALINAQYKAEDLPLAPDYLAPAQDVSALTGNDLTTKLLENPSWRGTILTYDLVESPSDATRFFTPRTIRSTNGTYIRTLANGSTESLKLVSQE
ncbi:hypothetical protein HYW32_01330 [Candidatus Berkelbacteria bacterium]|nr:hypothetical protein [Candidatus Berkelbacteria bacterium]